MKSFSNGIIFPSPRQVPYCTQSAKYTSETPRQYKKNPILNSLTLSTHSQTNLANFDFTYITSIQWSLFLVAGFPLSKPPSISSKRSTRLVSLTPTVSGMDHHQGVWTTPPGAFLRLPPLLRPTHCEVEVFQHLTSKAFCLYCSLGEATGYNRLVWVLSSKEIGQHEFTNQSSLMCKNNPL